MDTSITLNPAAAGAGFPSTTLTKPNPAAFSSSSAATSSTINGGSGDTTRISSGNVAPNLLFSTTRSSSSNDRPVHGGVPSARNASLFSASDAAIAAFDSIMKNSMPTIEEADANSSSILEQSYYVDAAENSIHDDSPQNSTKNLIMPNTAAAELEQQNLPPPPPRNSIYYDARSTLKSVPVISVPVSAAAADHIAEFGDKVDKTASSFDIDRSSTPTNDETLVNNSSTPVKHIFSSGLMSFDATTNGNSNTNPKVLEALEEVRDELVSITYRQAAESISTAADNTEKFSLLGLRGLGSSDVVDSLDHNIMNGNSASGSDNDISRAAATKSAAYNTSAASQFHLNNNGSTTNMANEFASLKTTTNNNNIVMTQHQQQPAAVITSAPPPVPPPKPALKPAVTTESIPASAVNSAGAAAANTNASSSININGAVNNIPSSSASASTNKNQNLHAAVAAASTTNSTKASSSTSSSSSTMWSNPLFHREEVKTVVLSLLEALHVNSSQQHASHAEQDDKREFNERVLGELAAFVRERDDVVKCFVGLNDRYEKCKHLVRNISANEKELKQELNKSCNAVQQLRSEKIDTDNRHSENNAIKDQELARVRAALKMSEMKCRHLEEEVRRKQAEKDQVSQLVEELSAASAAAGGSKK